MLCAADGGGLECCYCSSVPTVRSFEAFESCIPVRRMSIIRLVCRSVKFRVPELCHLTTLLKEFRKPNFRFRKPSLLIFFENSVLETDLYMMYYFLASCLPLSLSISTPSTNRERATRLSLVINHKIHITTVAHFYRFARIDSSLRYS